MLDTMTTSGIDKISDNMRNIREINIFIERISQMKLRDKSFLKSENSSTFEDGPSLSLSQDHILRFKPLKKKRKRRYYRRFTKGCNVGVKFGKNGKNQSF